LRVTFYNYAAPTALRCGLQIDFSTQSRKAAKTQSIQIFPLRLRALASLR
jgi:hypothetical protein